MRHTYRDIQTKCLKPDESIKPWYARHITHRISIMLIWIFQGLRISPNVITLLSLLSALISIIAFAFLTPYSILFGAIMMEMYYVLDAVDGQWARFTGIKSLSGAFFDYCLNYLIQPLLFFGLGYSLSLQISQPLFALIGFAGGMSSLWVMLIWDLRASVLGHPNQSACKDVQESNGEASASARSTVYRQIFGWLHKIMVFPWLMHVLTLFSITSFLLSRIYNNPEIPKALFSTLLLCYGVLGPLVATLITSHWILRRRLDP